MPRTCTRVFGAVLLLCTALEHCTAFLVPPAPASSFAASAKSVHRCAARPTPEVRVGGLCRARGTRGRAGVAWAMQAQLQTYLTQTDDYSDISQVDQSSQGTILEARGYNLSTRTLTWTYRVRFCRPICMEKLSEQGNPLVQIVRRRRTRFGGSAPTHQHRGGADFLLSGESLPQIPTVQ